MQLQIFKFLCSLGEESSQLEEASRKLAIRNKLLQQGEYVSLNTSVLKMATDYYTEEELSLKFKKTKVKVSKVPGVINLFKFVNIDWAIVL